MLVRVPQVKVLVQFGRDWDDDGGRWPEKMKKRKRRRRERGIWRVVVKFERSEARHCIG